MGKKSMADVWKEMERQHGSQGIMTDDVTFGIKDVISTGSYALDDALGIYGIPKCGITQMCGKPSGGKTLLALSTIAQWQRQDPSNWAMFIDCEYTYSPDWAAQLGVDNDRIMVYRENNGVKIFERLVGQPSKTPGKKAKQGILDLEIASGGTGLGIIALDSIAAIVPALEETSEVGKSSMALLARFLPAELRKLTPMLSEAKVAFIAINQIRDSLDPYAPAFNPGGNALRHAEICSISFTKMNGADSKIERNGDQVGHKVKSRVEKNKVGIPYRSAEFSIEYTKGVVNQHEELRVLGCKYGVIVRPNNRTYVYEGITYNGKDAMAQALKDETVQKTIWEKIKDAKANMLKDGGQIIENAAEVEESEE